MPSKTKKSSHTNTLLNAFLLLVFIALLSVIIIVRIRTLGVPIDRDVGEYAYAGQLLLEGVPPYSLVYNMKMPGIYAAYALVLACFGQTQFGINTAILVINAVTVILLFLLAKKLFGPIAALACAVFFAITSVSQPVQATANAENFVLPFAIAGLILLVNFTDSKKYLFLITAGILLGIAFMMKQHGAAFIIFGFVLLLRSLLFLKPLNYKKLASVILFYSFSVILPFLLTCIILWYCGLFEKFWFWTFEYAPHYINLIPLRIGLNTLRTVLVQLISSAPLIWLLALLGILSIIWNKNIRRHAVFLLGLLACSFLALCPGFYFRNHYFLLFMPAIVLLAAAGVIAIGDLLNLAIKSPAKTSFISILIILAVWLQTFYIQRLYLLETDTLKISRISFGMAPFPESLAIADYIKNNSRPDDKIAVLGSEPQIYFYSHRRSATSYIYTYPLMENQPYALDMQREMISQLEANKPKFIVFVQFYYSWLPLPESNMLLQNWINQYIPSYYHPVGLVELPDPETFYLTGSFKSTYHWGSFNKPAKNDGWILILQRNN